MIEIIPQSWVDRYAPLPHGWWSDRARGLQRMVPGIADLVDRVAREVGVDPRLLVTRMELEQSAISYAWDGSTRDYGGGKQGEQEKLRWLCGVDKTDSGPRPGAWEGPERQLLGCALRFKYWYRGKDGHRPEWRNWLGLKDDPAYRPGVSVVRKGVSMTPSNQASADCLRYTSSLPGSLRLREIGLRWFGEDYSVGENTMNNPKAITIVLDPGHSDNTHQFPGGYREGRLVRLAAVEAAKLLRGQGHRVYLTRETPDADPSLADRARVAVDRGANVFVSLHTDASDDPKARGVHAIFYARDKAEAWKPDSEILAPKGRALARSIAQAVAASLGLPLRNAQYGGAAPWWRCPANLGVLTNHDNWRRTEAACLVEAGFGSSPEDRAVLMREDAPMRYALGVCRGIYWYLGWPIPDAWGATPPSVPVEGVETQPTPEDRWRKEVADAVAWARERGISDGSRIDEPATRGEVLVMLRRLL